MTATPPRATAVIAPDRDSDADLLARFRGGEPGALTAVFERYELPLYRYLCGLLRDRHAAEDVLQDTFVVALQKADGITGGSFRGWLFTVAHQQAMLTKRKGKRAAAVLPEAGLLALVGSDADPAAVAAHADSATAVRSLLAQLPEPQQAVIRLRVFDGLKFREVADRLGCPLNTALARMHDGLRNLRRLWEERYA